MTLAGGVGRNAPRKSVSVSTELVVKTHVIFANGTLYDRHSDRRHQRRLVRRHHQVVRGTTAATTAAITTTTSTDSGSAVLSPPSSDCCLSARPRVQRSAARIANGYR